MILPLGGRGRGFDSRSGPMHHWCSGNICPFQGRAPVSITGWCILFWESSSNGRALALHARGNGIDAHVFHGVLLNPILPTFLQRNGKSIAPFIFSRISLVAEHRTCNAEVVSSILTFGFIFLELCLVALIRFDFGQFFQYM